MSDEEPWLLDTSDETEAPTSVPSTNASSMLVRAERHLDRHDVGLALRSLDDAARTEPEILDGSRYWLLRSAVLTQRAANEPRNSIDWADLTDDAIQCCGELLRIAPHSASTYLASAEANAVAGYLTRAEELILEALRLDPEYPEAYSVYASVLTRAGETEAALDVVERGLRLAPDHDLLLTARRDALFVANDAAWADANRDLLRVDPMSADALHMASVDASTRGDYGAAAAHARSAAREIPGNEVVTGQARRLAGLDHWSLRPIRPVLVRGGSWWLWIAGWIVARMIGNVIAGPSGEGMLITLPLFLLFALYVYWWPSMLARRSRP